MNYLLLLFHPTGYWQSQSTSRDQEEEEAFAEFCSWMRSQGITWESNALAAPQPAHRIRFTSVDAATRMLPELGEAISGYFLLSIRDDSLLPELLSRVPHIESTGVELRALL